MSIKEFAVHLVVFAFLMMAFLVIASSFGIVKTNVYHAYTDEYRLPKDINVGDLK